MTLLDENTMMRADLDDMKDMMDNLKQKIMLDQKVANRKVVPESPQTTEEIVANALAEVIKERKEKALKEKGRKESRPVGNNIFHI
jgi:6-pyruvoyl-tetrahydropterin synthase